MKNKKPEKLDELMDFLELSDNFTSIDLEVNYRKLALKYHPDRGGSSGKMQKLNEAKHLLEGQINCKTPSIA